MERGPSASRLASQFDFDAWHTMLATHQGFTADWRRKWNFGGVRRCVAAVGLALLAVSSTIAAQVVGSQPTPSPPMADIVARAQAKVVKIHGAGGPARLESYQSGTLISPRGHVLTAWSYVLDTDDIAVTLDDGRQFSAQLVGADVRLEIAVLKIDAEGLPHFDLKQAATADVGERILALSNLYNVATGEEPVSVQRGVVAAKTTLAGRRGTYNTPYQGPIYVLDAITSNPGAAGGAVVNDRGELVGLLGKELRHSASGTWLNYAVPIAELRSSVDDLLAGKSPPRTAEKTRKPPRAVNLDALGIVLVPDVVARTPAFVDEVRKDTPAERAGLRADDLVLMINGKLVGSCRGVVEELSYLDVADPVKLTIMRRQEVIEVTLSARKEPPP